MVMAIIIISHVCMALILRIMAMSDSTRHYPAQVNAIAVLLREQLDAEISDGNIDRVRYTDLLQKIAAAWNSDIWLEKANGEPIASNTWKERSSFSGKTNKYDEYGVELNQDYPPLKELIVRSSNNEYIFYVKKTINGFFFRELHFIVVLLLITVITAFCILSVSRKITRPLKKLTESANAISRGEFNLIVHENSYDEVGELAKAFNLMSERVLQMINGTKKLTANISHQIYSPLTRLSVSLEILRDKIPQSNRKDIEEIFSLITQEIDTMVALNQKIITLIRIDTMHKPSGYVEVSLTDIAAETVLKFDKVIKQKGIINSSVYSKIPIIIKGLAEDISELFDIFYDNAIRYSPEKGQVDCFITEENSEVTIEIVNSVAAQLPPQALDSIFRPFQRFAPEKISGHGLGLAIAKGIVENHGGTISVESIEDKFIIRVIFYKDVSG